MFWMEIINIVANTVIGAVITLFKQNQEAKKEERKFLLDVATSNRQATQEARDFSGSDIEANRNYEFNKKYMFGNKLSFGISKQIKDKGRGNGFSFMRRTIAFMVLFTIITFPMIAPAFGDYTIALGYYDISKGFWPWSSGDNVISWFIIGDGSKPIVLHPILYNIAIAITSFFFGNQIAAKGK